MPLNPAGMTTCDILGGYTQNRNQSIIAYVQNLSAIYAIPSCGCFRIVTHSPMQISYQTNIVIRANLLAPQCKTKNLFIVGLSFSARYESRKRSCHCAFTRLVFIIDRLVVRLHLAHFDWCVPNCERLDSRAVNKKYEHTCLK